MFPFFITLVVIVVVIIAIVSIGRAIFGGGGESSETEEEQDRGRSTLLTVAEGNSVRLVVRGPIVAEEEHQSYSIEASPSSREMTVYKGYLDQVKKRKELSNNRRAYEQFVYALDKANMMLGEVPTDDEKNDLRGICAGGYIYEYSVLTAGSPVKRLWTTTCKGSPGSLNASVEQLNSLFWAQIPGSAELIPFRSSPFGSGMSF